MKTGQHLNRRRLRRARRQGARDFRPRPVAADMHDPGARMRRFQAQRQLARRVAVERRAIVHQIGNAAGRFARHQIDNFGHAQARACCHGIGGMAFPAVAFAHRRGDAALRPGA